MRGTPTRGTLPKGVWFQKKTLATGEVIRYGYLGRGPGMVALGREGSPDFHATLAEVMRRHPAEGKVAFLIWKYRSSPEFTKLRPLTQRDYNRQLDKIGARFGSLSLGVFNLQDISRRFYDWRDEMVKASPRQADYAVAVLKALIEWGVKRGYLKVNRAAGIESVYKADRSEKTWTEDQEATFLKAAPAPVRLGFLMASEAGLSPEDVYVLPWSAIQGEVLVWRRIKTGVPFAVPISPKLRKALDEAPRYDSTTILNTSEGLPYNPNGNGFRPAFRAARVAAGIEDRTHKDCRGTFITRRRSMGWTAEETALCSGHPIAEEKGAQGAYVDRAAVAKANAERLWNRHYRKKRGTRAAN